MHKVRLIFNEKKEEKYIPEKCKQKRRQCVKQKGKVVASEFYFPSDQTAYFTSVVSAVFCLHYISVLILAASGIRICNFDTDKRETVTSFFIRFGVLIDELAHNCGNMSRRIKVGGSLLGSRRMTKKMKVQYRLLHSRMTFQAISSVASIRCTNK